MLFVKPFIPLVSYPYFQVPQLLRVEQWLAERHSVRWDVTSGDQTALANSFLVSLACPLLSIFAFLLCTWYQETHPGGWAPRESVHICSAARFPSVTRASHCPTIFKNFFLLCLFLNKTSHLLSMVQFGSLNVPFILEFYEAFFLLYLLRFFFVCKYTTCYRSS